jgi:TolA-binding protein
MDPKDAVLMGIMAVVFCVPVLGITARLALKPIVDAIVRLRESAPPPAHLSNAVAGRVMELEDELRQLRSSVTRLEETVDFQQKLLSPPETAALSATLGER